MSEPFIPRDQLWHEAISFTYEQLQRAKVKPHIYLWHGYWRTSQRPYIHNAFIRQRWAAAISFTAMLNSERP